MFHVIENPTDVLKSIADKHKKLRKKKGLSQQELATRSGVSLGSIKRFERTGQISFISLLILAKLLNRLSDFKEIFHLDENLEDIEKLFSPKTRF